MKSDEYWNPILETLPHEQLELLQFKKFKEIFTWAHEHSKFYNQLYTHAGMAKQYDIKAIAALIESLRQDAEKKNIERDSNSGEKCRPYSRRCQDAGNKHQRRGGNSGEKILTHVRL